MKPPPACRTFLQVTFWNPRHGMMCRPRQVDAIAGACSAYNTKILSKTGLGDEDFFIGPENIEFFYRLKKKGN